MAMNYSTDGSDNITSFADLVSLSKASSLYNQLQALWGNQSGFSGEFLLDSFGDVTVSSHFTVLLLYIFANLIFAVLLCKLSRPEDLSALSKSSLMAQLKLIGGENWQLMVASQKVLREGML